MLLLLTAGKEEEKHGIGTSDMMFVPTLINKTENM
jgi:hypothetical protein